MKPNEKLRTWAASGGRKFGWIAEQVGVSRSTITAWIAGTVAPEADNRLRLERLTEGAVTVADWERT